MGTRVRHLFWIKGKVVWGPASDTFFGSKVSCEVRQVTFFGPKGQLDRRSVGAPHSMPPPSRAPQARGESSRVSRQGPSSYKILHQHQEYDLKCPPTAKLLIFCKNLFRLLGVKREDSFPCHVSPAMLNNVSQSPKFWFTCKILRQINTCV